MDGLQTTASRDGLVARNAFVLVGGRMLGGLLALGVLALLTRHLTLQEFGLYSYTITLLNLLRIVVGFGGNDVATVEIARDPSAAPRIVGALFGLRAIGALLATAVYVLVVSRETAGMGESRWALVAAGPFLLFSAGKAMDTVFQVRQRMHVPALSRLLGQVTFLVVLALLASTGRLSVGWAVLLGAGTPALAQLVTFVCGLRYERPKLTLSLFGSGPAFAFLRRAWPQALATVFLLIAFHADTVMLWHLSGSEETGVYSAAYRLFAFAVMIPTLLTAPLLPEMAKGRESLARFYELGFRVLLTLGLVGATCAFVLAPDLLDWLYGAESYARSVLVLRLLFVAFIGFSLATLGGVALVSMGAQRTWARIAGAALVVNLIVNAVLIPRHGAAGAAVATVVSEGLAAILAIVAVARRSGARPRARSLAEAGVAAALVGAVAWGVHGLGPVVSLAAFAALGGAVVVYVRRRFSSVGRAG